MTARSSLDQSTATPGSPTPADAPTGGTTEESDGERSEQVRTQFLRRVAHDIASPTGVTLTVLEELANGERPRPELVAMAKRSLRRLMRLSEHLALVAELETGTLEPDLASTDICALVKQAFDDAVGVDGRRDVAPELTLPTGATSRPLDARLVAVVLREIVGNALKLATTRVVVTLDTSGQDILFRVEDDGPGWNDETKRLLGKRFVKRSSARGLGLSLSMGDEILRSHGGSLTIGASSLPPNKRGAIGASVVVTLPKSA